MSRKERKKSLVTKVSVDRNTTTGKQLPLRLTEFELEQLEILTEKVASALPNKKITRSTVMRAAVYIHEDNFIASLAESIKENV